MLSDLLKDRGKTQKELAEYIGVTQSIVSYWNSRKKTPNILHLVQIAKFFNMTIDETAEYMEIK